MSTLPATHTTLAADPAAGVTRPRVTAVLVNGHARVSGGPFNWDSDLPPALGGTNQAPSPTAYLLGALAACAVAFANDTLAPEFGVEITHVTATAGCTADLGGLVALDGHDPDLVDLKLTINIDSPSPTERLDSLRRAWLERCPIYLALCNPTDVSVSFG